MQALVVTIKIKPDQVEAFIAATTENAAASRKEPGIDRFDLLQDPADRTRFILYEVYRDAGANDRHKETAHYQKWKALAEPMMAEPRVRGFWDLVDVR
jgi:quinol monooxygenase YgiN